jgi:hypothetical protein
VTMNENYALEFRPTIWDRLGFGHAFVPAPEDSEGFATGCLTTESTIVLDWKDRLRVLLSGRVSHYLRTQTDVPVTTARSISDARVLPPIWGKR